METNFFSLIAEIGVNGDLQIRIAKGEDNNIVVSVMLLNDNCKEKAKKEIVPVILNGSVIEMDKEFFEIITSPIQETSGLLDNIEEYRKKLEQARKESEMEKKKEEKEKLEKQAQKRKFLEVMQQVTSLEDENKYDEAVKVLPDPADFPDQADTITKRRRELMAKGTPTLFS